MESPEEEIIAIPSPAVIPAVTVESPVAMIGIHRQQQARRTKFHQSVVQYMWDAAFLVSCTLAVSVDPLFLYLPIIKEDMKCIRLDRNLTKVALCFRSFTDVCFILDIISKISPTLTSARVLTLRKFMPDEEVARYTKILWLNLYIVIIDILAVLPIPQVIILIFFRKMRGSRSTRKFMNFLLLLQYVPRIIRIYQSMKALERTPYKKIKTIWIGGVSVFFFFILASHVLGALWYFFSFQREIDCWYYAGISFDCNTSKNIKLLNEQCPINPPNTTLFDFGIFLDALQSGILSSTDFPQKFIHCFWWGLRNISSFGQNLQTSNYAWENLFAVFISVTGMLLVLICLNNILQTYMQSTTATLKENRKLREMREKRNPQIVSWLVENDLPLDLKEKLMEHALSKLSADEDINIKNIHSILPWKYLVDIKRHLCFNTLTKVPVLQNLDVKKFEAFCDYLKPVIYNEDRIIIRKGELFDKILLISLGTVRTYTSSDDGSSSSSNNDQCLHKGDYYGEELVQSWACNERLFAYSAQNLRCSTKVEAFTLALEDMKAGIEKVQEAGQP